MNILVIEDHGTQRRLADEVLSAAGHRVAVAASAEPAFAAIKAELPDVVLVDLRLPGLDGLALVRRLKSDAQTRGIPVVAVTAFPEEYTRTAALIAGCDAYIVKPVSTRALPGIVASVATQKENPTP